jgi:hypothetical protein
MTEIALRLKDQLLSLSEDDRAALRQVLHDSLPDEVEEGYEEASLDDEMVEELEKAEWIAELERRSAAADAGFEKEVPFREAIEQLRRETP